MKNKTTPPNRTEPSDPVPSGIVCRGESEKEERKHEVTMPVVPQRLPLSGDGILLHEKARTSTSPSSCVAAGTTRTVAVVAAEDSPINASVVTTPAVLPSSCGVVPARTRHVSSSEGTIAISSRTVSQPPLCASASAPAHDPSAAAAAVYARASVRAQPHPQCPAHLEDVTVSAASFEAFREMFRVQREFSMAFWGITNDCGEVQSKITPLDSRRLSMDSGVA